MDYNIFTIWLSIYLHGKEKFILHTYMRERLKYSPNIENAKAFTIIITLREQSLATRALDSRASNFSFVTSRS